MSIRLLAIFILSVSNLSWAQANRPTEKPKMQFMGAFDAGQPGVSIYKMFDPTDEVVCYVLMPEVVGRKQIDSGKYIYDGNTIGSISCIKVRYSPSTGTPQVK